MKGTQYKLIFGTAGTVIVGALVGVLSWSGIASATPGFQFNSEILSRVLFEEIHINSPAAAFRVKVKVEDPADVYVVRNRVPPGGHSGWHTHPGPSIVSVKAGVATVYDGDDPSCSPKTYPAGTGFIDEGGTHLHFVRNEGTVELETIAFQVVPMGAERRIDAPAPGFCSF
jgi:hypothetical protein